MTEEETWGPERLREKESTVGRRLKKRRPVWLQVDGPREPEGDAPPPALPDDPVPVAEVVAPLRPELLESPASGLPAEVPSDAPRPAEEGAAQPCPRRSTPPSGGARLEWLSVGFGPPGEDVSARDAEGRALARVLARAGRPSVALVCSRDDVALAAVAAAARMLGDSRPGMGGAPRSFCTCRAGVPEDAALEEFARHGEEIPGRVVFLPPMTQVHSGTRRFLEMLAAGSVQAVVRVDPALYHSGLGDDPLFRRACHAMFLQDQATPDVPWNL